MIYVYTPLPGWCSSICLLGFLRLRTHFDWIIVITPATRCPLNLLVTLLPSSFEGFAWCTRRRLPRTRYWKFSHRIHWQPGQIWRISRLRIFEESIRVVVRNAELLRHCPWSFGQLHISLTNSSHTLGKSKLVCDAMTLRFARMRQVVINGPPHTCNGSHLNVFL